MTTYQSRGRADDTGPAQQRRGRTPARKNTKLEIMDGAIDLFSRKGYTETSMREIALEAKIQPGSIYNHFSSKQEILEEILETFAAYNDEHMSSPRAVEDLKKGVTYEKLLDCMTLEYKGEGVERLQKMFYIILHEQHRNETVRKYVVDNIVIKNERYVKGIVDMLVENGLIEPVDSGAVAKLHVAAVYFWSNANLLGIYSSPLFNAWGTLPEALMFLYKSAIRIK